MKKPGPFSIADLFPDLLEGSQFPPSEQRFEKHYALGDPQGFVHEPITRFTSKQRSQVIRRLQMLEKNIADAYKPPSLASLINCLEDDGDSHLSGYTRNSSGRMKELFLVIISPPYTWKARIGRAGFFTVNPATMKPKAFTMTALN